MEALLFVDHKRKRIILKGNDFGGEMLEKDQEGKLAVNSYGMQTGFTMMGGVRNVMMRVGTRPAQTKEEDLYLDTSRPVRE